MSCLLCACSPVGRRRLPSQGGMYVHVPLLIREGACNGWGGICTDAVGCAGAFRGQMQIRCAGALRGQRVGPDASLRPTAEHGTKGPRRRISRMGHLIKDLLHGTSDL